MSYCAIHSPDNTLETVNAVFAQTLGTRLMSGSLERSDVKRASMDNNSLSTHRLPNDELETELDTKNRIIKCLSHRWRLVLL